MRDVWRLVLFLLNTSTDHCAVVLTEVAKDKIIVDKVISLCFSGEDISICVCLAILTSLFDDRGTFGHLISTRAVITRTK